MEQDNESTQVFNMMKSTYERRERNEYDVFGEMVDHNIRSLKIDFSKISVQQQIINICLMLANATFHRATYNFLTQYLHLPHRHGLLIYLAIQQ